MMPTRQRPLIAITLGDPTGVGPEITVKSLIHSDIYDLARIVVIGSPTALQKAIELTGSTWKIRTVSGPSELRTLENISSTFSCLPAGPDDWCDISPQVKAQGGEAAFQSLSKAAELALAKDVDAIVTCPLHKVALHHAGHDWPGHTELLAHLSEVKDHAMMLYLPPGRERHGGPMGFGVVHVTLHMALREVFQHLTVDNIVEKIQLANNVFVNIRTAMNLDGPPRIAVAALNPHAGEMGRFGREEIETIEPAVTVARSRGIDVVGPLPVDTMLPKAVDGKYDAVVAMYHDQGHIALKLLDMFDAVNITLGLPIVRTSVAHGTAHDIAWTNQAEFSGMVQAIKTASRLIGVHQSGQ